MIIVLTIVKETESKSRWIKMGLFLSKNRVRAQVPIEPYNGKVPNGKLVICKIEDGYYFSEDGNHNKSEKKFLIDKRNIRKMLKAGEQYEKEDRVRKNVKSGCDNVCFSFTKAIGES